jgi:dipeptide/tripeptide permease
MTDAKDPGELPELTDLEPLEELDELPAETQPATTPPPPGQAPAAPAQPREIERAPIMLQKSALILAVSALFPWLVADQGWDVARILAKVVILLGGWVAYCGIEHAHGHKTPLDGLGKQHKMVLPVLSIVLMVVGLAPIIDAGNKAIVEKAALAIGLLAWAQVHGYAKGGKFNPTWALIIPLFGLAGVIMVVTVPFMETVSTLNKAFAILGSVGVAAAGALAGFTLFISMKEAKAHGEAKKKAALEERKRQRAAARASQGGPKSGS